MKPLLQFALGQRATFVWLFLVAATCLSWAMGSGAARADAEHTGTLSTLIIAIALLKVRLVIRYFMEVREATWILRFLTDAWCAGVGIAILALYWNIFGTAG